MENKIDIPKKIIYYSDEKNEDFAATKDIEKKEIDKKYNYFWFSNFFARLIANFLYYLIAKPAVWILMKIMFHYKVVNKKVMRKRGKKGCFIYANHTNYIPDACFNSLLHSKRNYIIVSSQVVNIKGIVRLVQDLGAIPLGSTIDAKKNFLKTIKNCLKKNSSITIYPEAHIWPYCTFIRNFDSSSFRYLASYDVPVFTTTTCYAKRKHGTRPKIIFVIDGPFYMDQKLSREEAMQKMRNEVYESMVKATKQYSTYEYFRYIKKDNDK